MNRDTKALLAAMATLVLTGAGILLFGLEFDTLLQSATLLIACYGASGK